MIFGIFACLTSNAQNAAWPGTGDNASVGIGTDNPQAKLEVQSGTSGWLLNLRTNAYNVGDIDGIRLYSGLYIGKLEVGGNSSVAKDIYSNTTGLALYSNVTERLRINGNGNVGIGTSNAQGKLHILGNPQSLNFFNTALNLEQPFAEFGSGNRVGAASLYKTNNGTASRALGAIAGTIGTPGNVANYPGGLVFFTKSADGNPTSTPTESMRIDYNGNVGVETTDTKGYKLAVAGTVVAEAVTVKLQGNWPGYVFKSMYNLPTLKQVKAYIDNNQHLPELPSAAELQDGVTLVK
jgi:hypothetical protein